MLVGYIGLDKGGTGEIIERGGFLSTLTGASNSTTNTTIITGLANHKPADLGSDVDAIVPNNLPEEVRSNATDVHGETIAGLYNTEAAVAMTTTRAVARLDMVTIYLRSFRNIMEHDLSDLTHLHKRFQYYFNDILSELLRRLYAEELNQGLQIVRTGLVCV